MSCHSNQSEYALAFLPEQLNRPGPDGRNQLVALTEAGFIRRAGDDGKPLPPFDAASAAQERKLADPADAGQPLEARARAYLHANCGHCHSDHGGGAVALRLQFPVAGRRDEGGRRPPHARRLRPAGRVHHQAGRPVREHPVLPHGQVRPRPDAAHRLRTPGRGGAEADRAVDRRHGRGAPKTDPVPDGDRPTRSLADPKSALLARAEARPRRADAGRAGRAAGRGGEAPARPGPRPVRGLPARRTSKGERKLGSNPRPRAILALQGDAGRGEKLFWSQAVNCGSCHKVGDRGTPVGPDLSTIGKLRSREDLLESILEPSRRIEPKYAAYVAQTADGRSLTGLLVKRDENEVVLRDGQNKEIVLAAKDVEELRPSRASLMPDGQLAGLTAQEAADLLEYLATRP